jgi:hypothetical protein
VIFWPVAERASSLSSTVRLSQSGTTLSMPTTATCRSGRVVHMRPLPSLVTSTSVPVSATRKLAPERPMSAARNFSRRTRRAMAVSATGSAGASTPSRS